MVLFVVAAGFLTALFIFRRLSPPEFSEASPGAPVQLPQDEAAHFDVTTEWWYYTGFLAGEEDMQYAFELVFFKVFVPEDVKIAGIVPIEWISNPLYFSHLAISDLVAGEHVFYERSSFPFFWQADARQDRFQVQNGDWRAWGEAGRHYLRASDGRYYLRLDLAETNPAVLHGPSGSGVVAMGKGGNSHYYSHTDLEGIGLLYIDGVPYPVHASVWMDHQWGSWDSHSGFSGWDWFSLRLDDGSEIMLFDFRGPYDGVLAESGGTWIAQDGTTEHLTAGDYSLEVLERWTSRDTGAVYPAKWHLIVPAHDYEATVTAAFPEQEMSVQFGPIYWEGAVQVEGSVDGVGFVEMTGYADEHR
jgi:predicted secreted hydrolase